jgi:hypothetical protein
MSKVETLNIFIDKRLNKISFEDNYKQQCSLQKSNYSLENEIWLGVNKDIIGNNVDTRMHLTQEQVKQILPYLKMFSEKGEITLV